ncbi:hypothetical protein IOD14_36345 [Streptomyces sp. A2-16]|nr:hypothetical protein IOD14_36345 [Streptomyces sp. A2-16]
MSLFREGFLGKCAAGSQRVIGTAKGANPLERITCGTNRIAASVARGLDPAEVRDPLLLPAEVGEQPAYDLLGLRVLAGEEGGRWLRERGERGHHRVEHRVERLDDPGVGES